MPPALPAALSGAFNRCPTMAQPLSRNGSPAANRPRRLSITMPANVFEALERRSTLEGRSLSNLAAYLLEAGMAAGAPKS